jgi:hypothetical protein
MLPRPLRHRVVNFKPFLFSVLLVALAGAFTAIFAQNPVFRPEIDIIQPKLLNGCPVATDPGCFYKLKDVLSSGADFWTTPFIQYEPKTGQGDGYGEGANGPRSAQRHYFNGRNPDYPFLRLNGLDSQSCFECHNSMPPLPSQGTDVTDIINLPQQFLTRPLWGVAYTGPWLHDGRATSLRQAILFHGDSASGSGSDAAPVIDVFEKLTPEQQQSVVDFLLTLRLPTP